MKVLFAIILVCVTTLAIATERTVADFVLRKQKLDIEQQQLSLEVLKYINAQNEKLERDLNKIPPAQKPSLELRNLSFPREVVPSNGRNCPLPETAQCQPRPQRFLASNAACLPAGKHFL